MDADLVRRGLQDAGGRDCGEEVRLRAGPNFCGLAVFRDARHAVHRLHLRVIAMLGGVVGLDHFCRAGKCAGDIADLLPFHRLRVRIVRVARVLRHRRLGVEFRRRRAVRIPLDAQRLAAVSRRLNRIADHGDAEGQR